MNRPLRGQVVSLHLSGGHRKPNRAVVRATFIEGEGIEGDRHASSRAERQGYQVLLMDEETLTDLALAPGVVRENVTTAGIDLASLSVGQRLGLGGQVVLEISKPCSPCSRMDEVRPGLQKELAGRRGMLASVVRGGSIAVGAPVSVLEGTPSH